MLPLLAIADAHTTVVLSCCRSRHSPNNATRIRAVVRWIRIQSHSDARFRRAHPGSWSMETNTWQTPKIAQQASAATLQAFRRRSKQRRRRRGDEQEASPARPLKRWKPATVSLLRVADAYEKAEVASWIEIRSAGSSRNSKTRVVDHTRGLFLFFICSLVWWSIGA